MACYVIKLWCLMHFNGHVVQSFNHNKTNRYIFRHTPFTLAKYDKWSKYQNKQKQL